MREIQTEIWRDHIENDNRKTELQSKASKSKGFVAIPITNNEKIYTYDAYGREKATVKTSAERIENQIKHDSIEGKVKRNEIQGKTESGIKTKKSKSARVKETAKARIVETLKATAVVGATIGFAASKIIQSTIPNSNDDLSSESASKIKETLGNTANKSFEGIRKLAQRKAKSAKTKSSNPKGKKDNSLNIKKKALKKIKSSPKASGKAIGKTTGTALRGASSAVGAAQKVRKFSSGKDISSDLAEQMEAAAMKAAEKGLNASNKVVKASKKPVKAIHKKIKNIRSRSVKTATKKVRKQTVKTATKTSAKVTGRTIKTSVNAAKNTARASKAAVQAAKAAAKATVKAAKVAAQAIKAGVQAAVQAIQAAGEAIAALMATPVGWIILAVVLVVVLIVILFNIISGAVTAPVSVVSVANSSLSWIFGNDDSSTNYSNLTELYEKFEEMAHTAMDEAKTYYKEQINGINFGERDTLVINDTSFYPASSANGYIQNYIDNMYYDDYKYLVEMCYIKKLRDERAAQSLSEDEMPEVFIDKADIKDFLLNYCYEFSISQTYGQSCPSLNCHQYTHTVYHDEDCPDATDGECPGHPQTNYYCDRTHFKSVITIQPVSKDMLENDILMLTDDEHSMLAMALSILYVEIP